VGGFVLFEGCGHILPGEGIAIEKRALSFEGKRLLCFFAFFV